jgi:hypothetical protein
LRADGRGSGGGGISARGGVDTFGGGGRVIVGSRVGTEIDEVDAESADAAGRGAGL